MDSNSKPVPQFKRIERLFRSLKLDEESPLEPQTCRNPIKDATDENNNSAINNETKDIKNKISTLDINSNKEIASKVIIFENSSTEEDKVDFAPYFGAVQPAHNRIKQHTRQAVLVADYNTVPTNFAEVEFKDKVTEILNFLLNKTYDTPAQNCLEKKTKIVIKLGKEYFFSRYFKWRNQVSIHDLGRLLRRSIPNTDREFYNAPYGGHSNRNTNQYSQLLNSSFTDHLAIKDYEKFRTMLAVQKFQHSGNIIIYKMNITNTNGTLMRYFKLKKLGLLASDEEADKFIIERITCSPRIELKFDRFLKLDAIAIHLDDVSGRSYSVDYIRFNSAKFDTRFKISNTYLLNANSYKKFNEFEEIFKDCIIIDKETENSLLVEFYPIEIEFLRKNCFTVYSKKDDTWSNSRITLNDYIEYGDAIKASETQTLLKQAVIINSHIQIMHDFENTASNQESLHKTIEFLYEQAIELSERASTCL